MKVIQTIRGQLGELCVGIQPNTLPWNYTVTTLHLAFVAVAAFDPRYFAFHERELVDVFLPWRLNRCHIVECRVLD